MPKVVYTAAKGLHQKTNGTEGAGIYIQSKHIRQAPLMFGMSTDSTTSATTMTYTKNTVHISDWTGAAAQVTTLPAAEVGVQVIHAQEVDAPSAVGTLSFVCASGEFFEAGCLLEGRSAGVLVYDTSAATDTTITFTSSGAATNFMSAGSKFIFTCTKKGYWLVELLAVPNPASTGVAGTCAFS